MTVRWRGRFSAVSAAILGTVAWTAALCLILRLVLRKYGEVDVTKLPFLPQAALLSGVLGIAGGLFLAACRIYGRRAVFDPATHTVIIGGLTGKRSVISFESIARVASIEEITPFSTRIVFCLVPKLSPLFGVSEISGPLKPGSEKYADFERRVLEIARMLSVDETRTNREGVSALPTARYRKDGACYVKNLWGGVNDLARAAIFLIPLSLLLLFSARAPYVHPIVFGVAAVLAVQVIYKLALFFRHRVRSVRIDAGARELRVERGIFGWGDVSVYPFSSVKCFEVFWRAVPGANSSRRKVSLVIDGAPETVEVIPAGRRGKDIADETRFLAGMFGLDPMRDITYKREMKYL